MLSRDGATGPASGPLVPAVCEIARLRDGGGGAMGDLFESIGRVEQAG